MNARIRRERKRAATDKARADALEDSLVTAHEPCNEAEGEVWASEIHEKILETVRAIHRTELDDLQSSHES